MLRTSSLATATTFAIVAISGCSSSSPSHTATSRPTPSPSAIAGTVTITGTAADLRLVAAAKAAFVAANPKATVQASVAPFSAELNAVTGGSAGAGMTDYPSAGVTGLTSTQKLVDHQVAVNRLIVVADPNQKVTSLSPQQVADIFAGRDTNWSQVGGANEPIVAVGPPGASGTRRAFDKLAMAGSAQAQAELVQPTTRGVAQLVSTTPGAIGYMLASEIEPTDILRRMQVGSTDPTALNVERGTYPLWFHVHLYTLGPATGATAEFIRYLRSAAFQDSAAAQLAGFVPINRVFGVSGADS